MKYPKTCEQSCASAPTSVLWHKDNELTANQVFKFSHKEKKWNCFNCNHVYDQSPANKNANNCGCPFCANKKLCEQITCQTCLQKSCESLQENKKMWHIDNQLYPIQVFKFSDLEIKWNCLDCNHTYDQSPDNKNRKNHGCPFCANISLCENPNCQICFEKSCDSLPSKILWHHLNQQKPRQVFKFSNKTIKWKCFGCIHSYDQSPNKKNGYGRGCPFCANKKLCEDSGCKTCFDKSCDSLPENVKIWHPFNKLTSRQVFQFSAKKIKWSCFVCNHTYKQSPNDKNSRGNGCPICKHKTERKIYDFIKSLNIKVKREFKLNKCTKKYDFLLKDFDLIIECDGFSHFQDVNHFKSTAKEIQNNDVYKMKKAILQNYSFLRIYQPDVLFDKIDWQQIIKDSLFIRQSPTISYYSQNLKIYDAHKLLMN